MKGTTEQQDAVICSQCDGERRTNSQMRGVSGSLQAEGFGEMADWLEPRQHICVALRNCGLDTGGSLDPDVGELWSAYSAALLFKVFYFLMISWCLNIQICLQIISLV